MMMVHYQKCLNLKMRAITKQKHFCQGKIYLQVKSLLNKQALSIASIWERKKEEVNINRGIKTTLEIKQCNWSNIQNTYKGFIIYILIYIQSSSSIIL